MGLWKWDFGNGTLEMDLEMGLWKWDFGNGFGNGTSVPSNK